MPSAFHVIIKTTCVENRGWLYKLNLHPRHQLCTDDAQKAETVLSAVRPSSNVELFMRRIKSFDLAHEKFDV